MFLRLPAILTLTIGAALAGHAVARHSDAVLLATTTSTHDSGLLDSLLPRFEQTTGTRVKVIAVGTGAALAMAREGDVDAVLVHAPSQERELVASGDLVGGRLVMYNDFVLAGPADDPARVRGCTDLVCAMRALARGHRFISRGDASGTHARELALWRLAGITPDSVPRSESGQGMGATLDIAAQQGAYTLVDRGTFLSHRAARLLTVVYEGDPALLNMYHIYVVNPARHPGTRSRQAEALADYFISKEAQAAIGRFGLERTGRPLFHPVLGRDTTRLFPALDR